MIKTRELDKYIHNILLKRSDEVLTEEDIKSVKRIALSGTNYEGEKIEYDLNDLKKFSNLKSCTLELFDVNDDIIEVLNSLEKLENLTFAHCDFNVNKKLKSSLKNLIITYPKNGNYDVVEDVENIETLEFLEVGKINISDLTQFKNVSELYIYNSEITNISEIVNFTKLTQLKLDGTKVDNEEVLTKLDNIKIQKKDTYLPIE